MKTAAIPCIRLARCTVALQTWLALSAAAIGAEAGPATLAPGTRIRIAAPAVRATAVVGVVRSSDEESITLAVPDESGVLRVRWGQITRLEASQGRGSRWRGALIGLLSGAAVGALVGKASYSPHPYRFESESVAAGAALGALVGTGIGAVIPPSERWQDVPRQRARLSIAPRVDGAMGLSIAVVF